MTYRMKFPKITFAALLIWMCAPTLLAADGPIASPENGWPQWRGPRRDGISDEKGLLAAWPAEGPKLLWKAGELGRGWSSPVIVGDSIFITGDAAGEMNIFCLDLSGKLKWKSVNGAGWQTSYPGARATCAYSEGVLYHMNASGRLAAFDPASGQEKWNVNVLKRFESANNNWGLAEGVLIDGPRIIVTPGGPKAMVAALDKKTGDTIWASEPIPGDKAAYAPPVLFQLNGRRLIAGCSSKHGFGVDAENGKLLWSIPVANTWGATCCTPIYGDGCVFYGAPDGPLGLLVKLNITKDSAAADVAWHTPVDPLNGSGIFRDGVLYANGCKKSRSLHCLDWKTGESRYEVKFSTALNSHATGALLWADGHLYCLFENGIMCLFKPGVDKFETAGQFQFVDSGKAADAWSHPVVLNSRLYLRYHETLYCYDVKQP
jgi:outer membrane protein assembly factor BamB